jgi:hypothetical protein
MSEPNKSQNVLNKNYRQPETVQLSPDALVFINGSNLLTDPEGNTFDIRQDITEINISLNVDAQGTASFTISYPEHSGGKIGQGKYANLKVMSEIVIYFRGRFQKEEKFPYYQSFWGVVSAITENYSDGVHTLSVSCADILRWWQITNVTINPSLLATRENISSYLQKNYGLNPDGVKAFLDGLPVKDKSGRQVSIFSNIFADQTIPEIFDRMCTASLLQMMPVDDYLSKKAEAVSVGSDLRKQMSSQQMLYWTKRLNQIGRRLRIYGLTVRQDGRQDIDMTKVVSGAAAATGDATTIYQTVPNAPPVTKSDRRQQLEIANEIKEAIHFEFFMDVNGDLILKPPFYNLDVGTNTPTSIIHDVDIINWNFVQSESEVATRVDVTGQIANVSTFDKTINGIAYDPLLALQFGERPIQRTMPWLHTSEQCLFWAKAELTRQNALIRQGTVTIIGRPELRLGYPVYIPSRDAFYYVKGIESRFAFGGTYTCTLTLVAERRKTDTVLGLFRNVGEVKDEQIPVLGESIAEPDETNNFVKQLSMTTVCTPRAKEHQNIVQPDFTIDLSKTSSDILSEWQITKDAHVDPTTGKEFQITDNKGYEIIGQIASNDPATGKPYLSYGYFDKLSTTGAQEQKTEKQTKASKALTLDISTNSLKIDPNNDALTLDSIGAQLIDYGSSKSAPSKANNMSVAEQLEVAVEAKSFKKTGK